MKKPNTLWFQDHQKEKALKDSLQIRVRGSLVKSFFFSCCNLECRHLILRRVTQLVRRRQGVFQLRHFTTMGKTIHNLTLNRENSNKNFGFRIIGGKDEGQTFKVSIGYFLLGHTVIFILGGKSVDGIPSLLCWNEGPRLSD